MRLLYCTVAYPAYVRQFYGVNPLLELECFEDQLVRLDEHAFAWIGAWKKALAPYGYEVYELLSNVMPLQRTWAWQYDHSLLTSEDPVQIAVEQAKRIRPDILFVDHLDEGLLRAIKEAVPSLRLALGWIGGTVSGDLPLWKEVDVVLSCAPESVAWMRERGYRSEQMHHGFNHAVLERMRPPRKVNNAAFFGQIVTTDSFHKARERFFERLAEAGLPLELHSPSFDFDWRDDAIALAKIGLWGAASTMRAFGVTNERIARMRLMHRAAHWTNRPSLPVSRKLKPHLRPGVYGLDMFQAIADSKLTLNVHADSSIRSASNMRLFETAGAGTCLVTDWRDNIPELFEPDKEIVTFRSIEECIEKVRWLLDRPHEYEAIGKAAQARALRQHTYAHRAARLHEIIHDALP